MTTDAATKIAPSLRIRKRPNVLTIVVSTLAAVVIAFFAWYYAPAPAAPALVTWSAEMTAFPSPNTMEGAPDRYTGRLVGVLPRQGLTAAEVATAYSAQAGSTAVRAGEGRVLILDVRGDSREAVFAGLDLVRQQVEAMLRDLK